MNPVVTALGKYNVEKRPEDLFIHQGKYDHIITALKNLANDKCITFLPSDLLKEFKTKDIQNFRTGLAQAAFKRHKLKTAVVEKDGLVYVFTRS